MNPCPICHLRYEHPNDYSDENSVYCIEALMAELEAARWWERVALGQLTLARQSAHEMGDKLRTAQETIRNLESPWVAE